MATAALNPIIAEIHGRTGKTVFYHRYGKTCIRLHVIPRNPDTEDQRTVRRSFAQAVKSWQGITQEKRDKFNRRARNLNMSGYNLYISEYLRTDRSSIFRQPAGKKLYSNMLQLRFRFVKDKNQANTPFNTVSGYNMRVLMRVQEDSNLRPTDP